MGVAGLVVAGGAGERMSRSGSRFPKPLVLVRGVTLLERNVFALLRAGITDVHVAVSARADAILQFAQSRCREMAEAVGATLSIMAERQPLGSIGPSAFLRDRDAVLVVNADNLTNLDLGTILASHRASGPALTLAVHDQPFPLPFGQVTVQANRVVAYVEKPTLVVTVCSAVSVLSKAAVAAMEPGESVGLPDLVHRLLRNGAEIRAFPHDSVWIDVNDLTAVKHAEALVVAHAKEFELWPGQPHRERVAVILSSRQGVALERGADETWCLPSAGIGVDEDPLPAVAHVVEERVGSFATSPHLLAVFDDLDPVRGGVVRTRLFCVDLVDGVQLSLAQWIRLEDMDALSNVAPSALRALAARAKD